MRAVLALLLGLLSIAIATDDTDDSGEAFSWDSSDTDQDQSYNGLVVQVYNPTDGDPVVTLGTDLDNHEATYCLTLARVFEATGYDFTAKDSDYTEIDGTSVDLKDADCTVTETSSTTFTIACSNVDGASLTFDFSFVEKADGDEGLEYTISLDGYTLSQDAQLVLVQTVTECSDLYEYSADSGSESDEESEEETEEPTSTEEGDDEFSTEAPIRRLAGETSTTEASAEETESTEESTDDDESDSADEESGISSDDSDEYDSGYAQFIVNGQAYNRCDGADDEPIDSALVYDEDKEELAIIFAHFTCNLYIDPYIGVDGSKLTTDDSGANGIYVMVSTFIGLIGALLF